jgi:hypothetical protein
LDEGWSNDLAPAGVDVLSAEKLTGGFANTALAGDAR